MFERKLFLQMTAEEFQKVKNYTNSIFDNLNEWLRSYVLFFSNCTHNSKTKKFVLAC